MSNEHIGCLVSIECVERLGTYQGIIDTVDAVHQSVTITHAFRNGVQCDVPKVTIMAPDIKCLKLLKTARDAKEMLKNTVFNYKNDTNSVNNSTKLEVKNLASINKKNNNFLRDRSKSPGKSLAKVSSPLNSITFKEAKHHNQKDSGKNHLWNDTFVDDVNQYEDDFDFEKNHALFDKKAEFKKIEAKDPFGKPIPFHEKKYKCDENVLSSKTLDVKQIECLDFSSKSIFVTDSGLEIPTISIKNRNVLFEKASEIGITSAKRIESAGRSASEMILNLLGGASRLNPLNVHQTPFVVILAGPHSEGALGVNCARQLSCHGIKVCLFVPKSASSGHSTILDNELKIFSETQNPLVRTVMELPIDTVDMIVSAIDTHHNTSANQKHSWYIQVKIWSDKLRAPVLVLDPPQEPDKSLLSPKWSFGLALPLNINDVCGQLYLCDLGIPKNVFKQVGIAYTSPFAHKFLIPLHKRK